MSYWTKDEQETVDFLLTRDDTISCWIATRINGASASMACTGNVSTTLLKELDSKVLPLIKKENNA